MTMNYIIKPIKIQPHIECKKWATNCGFDLENNVHWRAKNQIACFRSRKSTYYILKTEQVIFCQALRIQNLLLCWLYTQIPINPSSYIIPLYSLIHWKKLPHVLGLNIFAGGKIHIEVLSGKYQHCVYISRYTFILHRLNIITYVWSCMKIVYDNIVDNYYFLRIKDTIIRTRSNKNQNHN